MPITKSVKKSLRSSLNKRRRNEAAKKKLEIALKEATKDSYRKAVSLIDKAAKRRIYSKAKAARIKSRLARKLNLNNDRRSSSAGKKQAKKSLPATSAGQPSKKSLLKSASERKTRSAAKSKAKGK